MEPIPYRIRIGVTGHRVFDYETELKKQLIEVLKTGYQICLRRTRYQISDISLTQ